MTTTVTVPENPDTRPLPEGWVQEYDERRRRWFYRQPSATPPRTSYAHPLGALKPTVAIQRTAPILNVRGQSQVLPKTPSPSPVPGGNPQQLYKNLSTPVTPVGPHGGASSSTSPNLPAHMRRILTVPVLGSPISPSRFAPPGATLSLPTSAMTEVTSRIFPSERRTGISSSPSEYLNHSLPPLPAPKPRTGRSSHRRFSTSDEPVRSTARPLSVQHFVERRQVRSQSVSNQPLPFIRPPEGRNIPRPKYQPTSFDPVPQLPIDLFAEPTGLAHHSRGTSVDPPRTAYLDVRNQPSRLPTPRLPLPSTPQQSQQPTSTQSHSRPSPSPEYQPPSSEPPLSALNTSQSSSQNPSSSSRPLLVDVGVQAPSDRDCTCTYNADSIKKDDDSGESNGAEYEPPSAIDAGGIDLDELLDARSSEGVGFDFDQDAGAGPSSIPMDAIQNGLVALGLGEDSTTFESFSAMLDQIPGFGRELSEGGYSGSEAPRYATSEGAPPYDPGF